ncbi:MAG: hypothetical protein J6O00_00600 [Clostridiales bacterium]|nr:hypothetical protein [Clostridiales bacterium]MBP3266201.1 hypothetical protein [Clostridiales bacterium]
MNKKNAKIRKDIEKYRKKQRETEAHLQVLNTMRIEAENEELVDEFRKMVGEDGDVLEKLEAFKRMSEAQQQKPVSPIKNYESEVEIDD